MSILIIFNREPYDGTDVTWNGLRLAGKLREGKQDVRIFLMNDAVDLARDVTKKPESYDQDLVQMLKGLTKRGVVVKVCGPRPTVDYGACGHNFRLCEARSRCPGVPWWLRCWARPAQVRPRPTGKGNRCLRIPAGSRSRCMATRVR